MILNNVLVSTDEPKDVDPKGLGHELFYSMVKYRNLIAQIDANTGRKQTYNELLTKCVRTAAALLHHGVKPGDLISTCTYNHMDTCVPILAGYFAGAVVAPVDAGLPADDMNSLLKKYEPKVIFVSPESVEMIEEVLKSLNLETTLVVFGETRKHIPFRSFPRRVENFKVYECRDLKEDALILCTGGSTGNHKGVCISHYSFMNSYRNFECHYEEGKTLLPYGPMIWFSGSFNLCSAIYHGCSRVVARTFDPNEIWRLVNDFQVNYIFVGHTSLVSIAKHEIPNDTNTSSLKKIIFGGGPTSKHVILTLLNTLPDVTLINGYGQTEVGGLISEILFAKDDKKILNKIGSNGTLCRGAIAKIVDINTKETLRSNQCGELRIKSDFQMNGYYRTESADSWDSEGFLKTGDICYYDDDGYIYFVDRLKDMIRYKSWTVPATYLEGILLRHPTVRLSFVTGVPDEDDGDHPVGVVVLKDGCSVTAKELEDFVADLVDERRKLRAGVVIVDMAFIPFAVSGKIERYNLRKKVLKKYFGINV